MAAGERGYGLTSDVSLPSSTLSPISTIIPAAHPSPRLPGAFMRKAWPFSVNILLFASGACLLPFFALYWSMPW